ncbi:hypothetical protein F511_40448 [Dorcoceras hygrometricum]|uniref:Uncharacterized protein n=1 Tax=Dorcoceras hygrometricum TaxID=472368 RepID=A0A2Z7C0U0_9LAMI|nr:hypothetical protein F511_40448 [Dorcoceras hygrometricum]
MSSRNAKISSRNVLSIQSQEDSGEAFDDPVASNSSIQSREDSAGSNSTSSRELIYTSCCYSSSRKKSRRKESKISVEEYSAINAQDGKNQWLRFRRAICLNSREQDLYYSGKQYNLQRMFARIWKEDKLAFWSAEEFWKLSNGKDFNRGYL